MKARRRLLWNWSYSQLWVFCKSSKVFFTTELEELDCLVMYLMENNPDQNFKVPSIFIPIL